MNTSSQAKKGRIDVITKICRELGMMTHIGYKIAQEQSIWRKSVGQLLWPCGATKALFHRRTRASYVYTRYLAWYNVVLTHGSTQV